ncbi:MAG: tRNA 2-thiouridine(34) synthase MnmA [Microthrixaceae bacterium]
MQVLAALSGGVDSSVAAALLAEEGHEVIGVTMRLWGGESDTGCCSVADVEDARRAAAQLGVDHHVFNFSDEFDEFVVGPYVADHAAGRTPNPCVECNRHLKFDVLLERAELLGVDAVATGHHARVHTHADGTRRVARGADPAKDQSYVLYPLTSADLARVRFPIGHLTKAEVRERAHALGLRTAAKPDSQDVCFITRTGGREEFLGRRIPLHPGRVVDTAGRDLGTTEAVELVTIGQRRGLGLAGGADRRFVVDVDVPGRTVTVGPPERLLARGVDLDRMVWADREVTGPLLAQFSAHGEALPATVEPGQRGTASVRWNEPQRRVAPGQSVVLYDGDTVVGGGLAARSPAGEERSDVRGGAQ